MTFRCSAKGFVFPRLNAQYRHKGGMHDVVHIIDESLIKFRGAKKKDRFRMVFFLSNPKDWHVISPQVSM